MDIRGWREGSGYFIEEWMHGRQQRPDAHLALAVGAELLLGFAHDG